MALRNRAHLGERVAHASISAAAATELFNTQGTDWPVSGDETRLAYGYRGARRDRTISVWAMTRSKHAATFGIVPGCTVELFDGTELTVTRVGTAAGWGTDSNGDEVRWNIDDVLYITA